MSPEVKAQVLDLNLKAGIMRQLMAKDSDGKDSVEQPRIPYVTFLAQQVIWERFSKHYWVQGLENLTGAIKEAKKTGKRIILTPRHEADADHLLLRSVLTRHGLTDFMNETVFAAGVNMLKRPYIRPFTRSEHVIYTATPGDIELTRGLRRNKASNGISEEIDEQLNRDFHTFAEISKVASLKFAGAAERGEVVVPYVEGGRSADGLMRVPERQFSLFFPEDGSALVVPVRLYGAREINPPNRLVRFHKVLPFLHQSVGARIGKYYSSNEVWDWVEKRARDANPVLMVGAHIANVDPRGVRESDLQVYHRLMNIDHAGDNNIPAC